MCHYEQHNFYVPAQEWETFKDPESIGWSANGLNQVQIFVKEMGSFAGLVVSHGRVLTSWGHITRSVSCRSIRKALLNSLFGIHVAAGHICLEWTLEDLNIDDTPPSLTEQEKQATIADLLTCRSGVYHLSNYQTAKDRARLPQRGSHPPGTFWYYNNWDFNTLGTIYEQCTQTHIFEEFDSCIARPLQMQDYRVEDMQYLLQEYSLHPSYSFHISARDLARFGLLYLRSGVWRGQHIVPAQWVKDSTTLHAQTPMGPGFGYLWWVCSQSRLFLDLLLPEGSYASYGFGGQYLLVIPSLDAVIVHMGDPSDPDYHPPTVEQTRSLLQLILHAAPRGEGTAIHLGYH
jgi:CubicO group peptidase (beta-lactamase class C family)